MTTTRSRTALLIICAAMGCGHGRDQPSDLRTGRSALDGNTTFTPTDDVSISNEEGGNGVTTPTGEMMVWNLTGTDGYTEEALIRFGSLSLPVGATVTGATLSLTFDNWSTGFSVLGLYVNNAWHVTDSLGWLNRDPNVPWATPGARGTGTDVLAGTSFTISGFAGTGDEVKTVALDPAVVQGWIDSPATNQGLLLVNQNDDAITRIYSSEDANPARWPQLTIAYTTGGGTGGSGGGSGCVTAGVGTWTNSAFSAPANPFTVTFDATPSAAPTDAVIGLSQGTAAAFTDLAAIVRFNPGSGQIDARNGGAYAAANAIPYTAGTAYHFRLVVDTGAHTYSAFVTPAGGSEQTIGSSYAFRTEQAGVSTLNNWASTIDADGSGTVNVCNFAAGGGSGTGGTGGGGGAPGSHPRIWLDPTTLSGLRAKAQAGAAQWTTLRAACNSYLGGTVNAVGQDAYPGLPNIGEGYQGDGYFDPVLNLGVCYQVGLGLSPPDSNVAAWGAKGSDVLATMAQFTTYSRDDGYGIRFYGTGMALGFDLLYPALSSAVKANVVSALNGWFDYFTTSGFGEGHPVGNYFAGYYAAKAYAALATDGDNANAAALWTDFHDRLHFGGPGALSAPNGTHAGVQSYYAQFMAGGGWPEGWGYGPLAVINMDLPSLAAKTAKGIDLIGDPSAPFTYPLDSGMHLMQFSWPSRTTMDDRDTLHQGDQGTSFPAQPSPATFTVTAGMLGRWNASLAPQFHAYARQLRAAVGAPVPWEDFLFWDDAAPEQSFTTLPLSYLSPGMGAVAMRSDWGTSATWASFRARGYVDYGYAGEEYYDQGGLAIVHGGTPLLANATGALVTTYPGSAGGGLFETQVYDDLYGTGGRTLFNTFANGSGAQDQFAVDSSSPPATAVSHYEDGGGYARLRGDALEQVYQSGAGISSWTRDVVYLRPSQFVVYDRTSVANTSGDQHMSWHLFFTPSQGTPPSPGAVRYDVVNPTAGYLGAVTTVLPASAGTSLVNVFDSGKIYRLEVRPSSPATDLRWLTVFDTASSSGAVAAASALAASSNVNGVLLASTSGNRAVLFAAATAGTTVAGPITFTEPAATTAVVVTDLSPNTGYSVSATVAGGNHQVTIQPGSGFTTTSAGTLDVSIAAGGGVSAGP